MAATPTLPQSARTRLIPLLAAHDAAPPAHFDTLLANLDDTHAAHAFEALGQVGTADHVGCIQRRVEGRIINPRELGTAGREAIARIQARARGVTGGLALSATRDLSALGGLGLTDSEGVD